jgi:two-component system, NtrC family, sensor histidine kinase KinB
MRLRNWLMLGYGAVLALATIGLGMGLITVAGLAATTGRMVQENFAAIEVGSRLRTLTSAQQMVLIRRLGERDTDVARLLPSFERDASVLLAEARTLARGDADELSAIDRSERALAAVVGGMQDSTSVPVADSVAPSAAAVPGITPAVVAGFEALRAATDDYYRFHLDAMVERGERIRRQANRLAIALGLLAGFTVLIGILVSLHLARRLSAPMERLAAAAARVAQGDFAVRLDRTGLHESDVLAQRFDEMTASLGRFHAMNLDRIVAEGRRLDQVVANIDDGLIILDERGDIERVNPVAAAQLEIDAEAALGRSLHALGILPRVAREVDALIIDPRQSSAAGNDIELGEGETAHTLHYSLLPFSDMARRGLILVLRDVTEARKFERMRTDFVLRASHELRTPITGMRMALGLLQDKLTFPTESREAEMVETLRGEMQRLVGLITALLDLSRLYARNYDLQKHPTVVHDLLQRTRQRFVPACEVAGLTLTVVDDESLPPVMLDVGAIERVLDNLIGNAIRHTPQGGSIVLAAAALDAAVEISVTDTGEGIAHADRARVFEPFVQVGRRVGGVGLGLAMCREIVQQHGGRIRLDSAPGQGCRFGCRLPLVDAQRELVAGSN